MNIKLTETLLHKIKWNTRQRLQYIEIMAFYTGVVTRSDVAKSFGISDAAATKDLNLYGQIAPENLIYKQNVFGFVPGPAFAQALSDLSPAIILPMIAENLATMSGPYNNNLIYGVTVDTLPLPNRLPSKEIVAQVCRAAIQKKKLNIRYKSMSDRNDEETSRIIEPHSLINTGLRWHIRAYNEDTFDFRDFVLSRIDHAECLTDDAESSEDYDEDWTETSTLRLAPHPKLSSKKRKALALDYQTDNDAIKTNATDSEPNSKTTININVRRALLGYTLQKLLVDTTADHSLNPNAHQLVIINREEIEPFAGWAFLS
ncbi:FIG00640418: hypothetical protein [hydrothermal vent metagenome]|uniref:Uncharacterized protein n=1 Tax=hydrothermal vent metagenome TaxID=652676 RepID=A0A3B0YGH9_9ZZZZ